MKLKFKVQTYQTAAVDSVIDCFDGQGPSTGIKYRIDPGSKKEIFDVAGFKNEDIRLSKAQLLANIQSVQKRQNLQVSDTLISTPASRINLDIEMETGTGKTYCYIKTMFEMNKLYDWTKFIVVVPSIAIREGVLKSLEITAEHFTEIYGKKARYFAYNSRQLHQLESFSSDAGINVMVINIQAFASRGQDNRRIYDELDDFQTRRPIDVISKNRPILILDEPQKMEGPVATRSLPLFHPLMILRYSATHRTTHNKVHRLDALDAFNQKLVKKINVRGISVKGLEGTNAYLYLESIEISKKAPVARIEMEIRQGNGIKRVIKRLSHGDDLFALSNQLDQYRGYVVADINANTDAVEFANGHILHAGDATGDVTESTIRRIQIRETVKAHFQKEQSLFIKGVKVLSLFFIDEVVKYRDYSREDEKGDYARMFEEEYNQLRDEYLKENTWDNEAYKRYLSDIRVETTHNGYFAIDKRTRQLKDPTVNMRGESAGMSDDVDAYDLILKDKERLLSFNEPVRFIFSHSALREGWDNPNVFVMCMLKHSDNTISRRQEVGRGLRISVNQDGNRMDNPVTVHDINILTVVASESYRDFVSNLQREISDSLSARPRKADADYFAGKVIHAETGDIVITPDMAKQICHHLIRYSYIDYMEHVTPEYHDAKHSNELAEFPDRLSPYNTQIYDLVDNVFSDTQLPDVGDDRKAKTNPLNANFDKKEFKELWNRINKKAVYSVRFDSEELIRNCIGALDKELHVTRLQYTIQRGIQSEQLTESQLSAGTGFELTETSVETHDKTVHSIVSYDLIGKLAENTYLTRKSISQILRGVQADTFDCFALNPEQFISETSRIINEQKATIIIERLSYDRISETFDTSIFTAGQTRQDFSRATKKLRNHIYDYVITDSKIEEKFANELDTSEDVVVYAKLPKGFMIPTPVNSYNPDWAISFREGTVKHIYFVAETKGSMSSMQLRGIENRKIECARKFFEALNEKIGSDQVKYDVVTDYGKLMEIVKS